MYIPLYIYGEGPKICTGRPASVIKKWATLLFLPRLQTFDSHIRCTYVLFEARWQRANQQCSIYLLLPFGFHMFLPWGVSYVSATAANSLIVTLLQTNKNVPFFQIGHQVHKWIYCLFFLCKWRRVSAMDRLFLFYQLWWKDALNCGYR